MQVSTASEFLEFSGIDSKDSVQFISKDGHGPQCLSSALLLRNLPPVAAAPQPQARAAACGHCGGDGLSRGDNYNFLN